MEVLKSFCMCQKYWRILTSMVLLVVATIDTVAMQRRSVRAQTTYPSTTYFIPSIDEVKGKQDNRSYSNQSPTFGLMQADDLVSLASATVIVQKKYHISFLCQQGKWIACIKQMLPIGYRMFLLPIYGEIGLSIGTLLKSTQHAQKEYIHVSELAFSDITPEDLGCIYIRTWRYPDGRLQVEIDHAFNYLGMSPKFIRSYPNLPTEGCGDWSKLFSIAASMMQEVKYTHAILSMDGMASMKKRLEQAMYQIFNRHVHLDNYPLFYNKLLTEVRNQLRAVCEREGGYIDYSQQVVDVGCKGAYIPSLWMEWHKVSAIAKNKVATFDLDKLCNALDIRLCKREALPSYAGDLLHHVELLASQKEELQLSSFPHLSIQSLQGSAWASEPISVAPRVATAHVEASQHIYLEEYDLPSSMHIPELLRLPSGTSVRVTFGSSLKQPENIFISADRLVDQRLIPSLIDALYKANKSVSITSIHISATTNGHDGKQHANSNHRRENGARAVDISKINGKNIIELVADDPLIVALQNALEDLPLVRENFGPYLRNKSKQAYTASRLRESHKNHIHFSIDR